jgi:hypothetical protein
VEAWRCIYRQAQTGKAGYTHSARLSQTQVAIGRIYTQILLEDLKIIDPCRPSSWKATAAQRTGVRQHRPPHKAKTICAPFSGNIKINRQ